MGKILQIIGFASLLLIAFIAGVVTETSFTFVDSQEDLIAEIYDKNISSEYKDNSKTDNHSDMNDHPEIDNISDTKEPG